MCWSKMDVRVGKFQERKRNVFCEKSRRHLGTAKGSADQSLQLALNARDVRKFLIHLFIFLHNLNILFP